ncbi:hypothetical protein MF621_004227 (plasmid) [Bacillus velezensis]|nr:hypothetical protein [Bacillus velezensis]KDN91251.1 hypothetical protein EF87_19855 [Bacillus amyloliquefaciens]MED2914206.1 hypothetical protein [Bacillus velezensis]UFD97700.1 hypothetical protein [Bacillus amyloliquefaciens]URJ76529.1 hypothetical protein MF619_004169 [Bacillus velezensis]URJ80535.1 hypothetical protein MF621_004227 [Bacillus velezensis]
MKIKFKTVGAKYKFSTAVIFMILLFFLSSRIIFGSPFEVENTKLNTPVSINNMTVEMTDRTYFSDKNLLEIDLMITDSTQDVPPRLEADVKEKSNKSKKYHPEIIKVRDDFYVLFISGLPKDWTAVSVLLNDKNDDDSGSLGSNEKLYSSSSDTKTLDVFVKRNKDFYEAKYIDLKIDANKKLIKEEEEKQDKYAAENTQLNSRTSSLKEDEKYQTAKEKEETESQISSNESKISSNEDAIKDSKEMLAELEKRNELLKKRKSNLVIGD